MPLEAIHLMNNGAKCNHFTFQNKKKTKKPHAQVKHPTNQQKTPPKSPKSQVPEVFVTAIQFQATARSFHKKFQVG